MRWEKKLIDIKKRVLEFKNKFDRLQNRHEMEVR